MINFGLEFTSEMSNRRSSLFFSVSDCLEEINKLNEHDNVTIKQSKKLIKEMRKAAEINLASLKKKAKDAATMNVSVASNALSEKVQLLKGKLEGYRGEVRDIDVAIQQETSNYNGLKAEIDELEEALLENKLRLENLRADSDSILVKRGFEIEFLKAVTDVYFLNVDNGDVAAIIGSADEPDVWFFPCGGDTADDDAEPAKRAWEVIKSMLASDSK